MMKFLKIFLYVLRSALFYPLLFIRGFFLWAANVLTVLMLFVSAALWLLDVSNKIALTLLISAFVIFLLKFLYDSILLKINPTNTDLILRG